MKKCFTFGLLVILLAFGFARCDGGDGNGDGDTYTVTIGTLTNGTITANPTSGKEGTEITLTVTPAEGYQLKAGTLKYGTTAIDEATKKFNLPAENVTVTAEFEIASSPYAGNWVSNQYHAQLIIEGASLLTATLQFREDASSPWENAAKGTLVIEGTSATLTYTHVWKNGAWSDEPSDITEAAPVIGSNPMVGTVTGSTDGSKIFDHLVKNGAPFSEYDGTILTINESLEIGGAASVANGYLYTKNDNGWNDDDDDNIAKWWQIGTITDNKITITLPEPLLDDKLTDENSEKTGFFASFRNTGNPASFLLDEIILTYVDAEIWSQAIFFYSKNPISNYEMDEDEGIVVDITAGWNIFIVSSNFATNETEYQKVSDIQEIYDNGLRWYKIIDD